MSNKTHGSCVYTPMSTRTKKLGWFFLAAIVAFLVTMAFVSCVGPRYKPSALFPGAELSWPAVEEDIDRGIADAQEDGELTQTAADNWRFEANKLELGLKSRNLEMVRLAPWDGLEPLANRGIDDKLSDAEIGPGVAVSLREQLRNFSETITQLKLIYQ